MKMRRRGSWPCLRRSAGALLNDRRGLAATEFAFIVPVMLVMFFGTVEFSSGGRRRPQGHADRAYAVRSDVASGGGHRRQRDAISFSTAPPIMLSSVFCNRRLSPRSTRDLCRFRHRYAKVQWSKAASFRPAPRSNADGSSATPGISLSHFRLRFWSSQTYLIFSEVSYH